MALNREAVVAAAEKMVARGKIDGAIKEYRKLVADNPTDATMLNRLGDLYVRISRNEEAVKLFTQIAERYTEDGFFVKAIAIFKKIIKLDPTRLPVYERLAELYHMQGLVSEARTQYQVLVDYYLKHGKVESAESVLNKMTALDSGDPTPHVKLAEIYRDRGEHDKELAEYRALAEMMIRHKRIDEATQVYARAIASSPGDLGFITDAVLGLKDAGHTAAAAKLLALAVEKNPQAEKIARIAGLAKDRRGETSSTAIRRPGVDEGRVFKVSDVASAPPELREPVRQPRPAGAPGATGRPELHPEDLRSAERTAEELERTFPGRRGAPPPTPAPAPPVAPAPPARAELLSPIEPEILDFDLELELESGELESAPAAPAVSDAAAGAVEPPIEWSFEPEPDLSLEMPELPAVLPAALPEPSAAAVVPEAAAPEVAPPARPTPERRLADLLAEAEVFRKYGLAEKALDRVREILREEPRHAGTLALAVQLALDAGRSDRALARAQELERVASETPSAADAWAAVRARLKKAGFVFEHGRPAEAPAVKKPKKDTVATLLDELAGLKPAKKAAPKKATAPSADLTALVEGLRPPPTRKRPAAPPPAAAAHAAPAPPIEPSPWVAPPSPWIEPPAPPVEPKAPPRTPAEAAMEEAIEDRLGWLDEAAARAATPAEAAPAGSAEQLFDEEEGFFDLAAELEEELTKEEIVTGREVLPREEPTLEEIVEGFKKGVAESLSPEDYDTHFNLGIAYREMGLLDEAIGEFQLAAKNSNYLLDCCSLLGGCFLEKGLPELAVKWYQRGLASPGLSEDANCAFLYDLGNLYVATGDYDNARRTLVELYGINSNYRDIVLLLEQLGSR